MLNRKEIPEIFKKVLSANNRHRLFDGCKKILVALSGGADSCCLLRVLCEIGKDFGFQTAAIHVNHGIRGTEADRDEEFARQLCKELGTEFFCEKLNIPLLAKKEGLSLELCARNKRYAIFEEYAEKYGFDAVAVAHNSCDNAETILFNLTRGSGANGMCGIPAKRKLCGGISIIRPLIYATRQEIEDYLKSCNSAFMTDSTNLSDDYTRNFIRHRIMPLIRELNPNADEAFQRLSHSLQLDREYLDKTASSCVSNRLEDLAKLDRCILSRVIVRLFSDFSSEMPEQKHINELCGKIYSYKENPKLRCSVSFPGKVRAYLHDGVLSFNEDVRTKPQKLNYKIPLQRGFNVIEGTDFAIFLSFCKNDNILQTITHNGEIIYKKYTTDYLYSDIIPDSLFAVPRKDGDVILSCGMNKSVKQLMSKAKIPICDRYSMPLITSDDKLILIPGVAKCDLYKNKSAAEYLSVTLYRKCN